LIDYVYYLVASAHNFPRKRIYFANLFFDFFNRAGIAAGTLVRLAAA
jgi:hypothetical protein